MISFRVILLSLFLSLLFQASLVSNLWAAPSNIVGPSDSLVIRNVYLIGRQGVSTDVLVNVLLINGTLAIITRDEIREENALVLDGAEGFLLGNLIISGKPSFVIVNDNPRENIEVILNTANHIRFVIRDGNIIKNELPLYAPDEKEVKPRKVGYTGYVPPPLAVPLSYYDSRKWNRFSTKIISGLFTGAIALDRLQWLSQDGNNESQVGDLEETSIGEVRAIRLGFVGTLNFKRPWIYTVFATSNGFDRGYDANTDNPFLLYDLRLDIPLAGNLNMSVGKQKEPISMERLYTLLFMNWQERSAAGDAFIPARNWGVTFNGTALDQRMSWATGIFKNVVDSKYSASETPAQWTTRITGLPILSNNESNLLHVGFAFRYSDAKQPFKGKTEAEFFGASRLC